MCSGCHTVNIVNIKDLPPLSHLSHAKKTVMKLIGNTWDYDFDDAAFIILS